MKLLETLRRHPVKLAALLLGLAAAGWFVYHHRHDLDRDTLIAYGEGLPAAWLLALFFVLPLAGFSITLCLIVVGMRFGFTGGLLLTAVIIPLQHIVAFRLTHGLFRSRLRAFLQRTGYAIPPIPPHHQVKFTALFAAVHGPPYFAKLYLLALTDVSFRIFCWVGSPVYWLFAALPLAAGSAVTTMNLKWISVVAGCLVLFPLAGYWLRRKYSTARTQN